MSSRATFRANLERFSRVTEFFGEQRLKDTFQPRLTLQETCIGGSFVSGSVYLDYLEGAIAQVGEIDGFRGKIQRLQGLSRATGYPQFKSEVLEVWLAAQFCKKSLSVTPEPVTQASCRAEFAVTVDGISVYFEVRNLERPAERRDGFAGEPWPRARCSSFSRAIRNAYYHLPYPYEVELRRYRVGSSPEDSSFEADVSHFVSELGDLLHQIDAGKLLFEDLSLEMRRLPRHRPVAEIVRILPGSGSHASVHFGGEWTSLGREYDEYNELRANAYPKINTKARQLRPNAPNVLVIGLPVDVGSRQFAQDLLGPLEPGGSLGLVASNDKVSQFEQVIQQSVAAFLLFQPADSRENYPGWSTAVKNPLSGYTLPGDILRILIDLGNEYPRGDND